MRKLIGALAVVAGLIGGYAMISDAAPPKGQQDKPSAASQEIRKTAVKNPLDALAQAQSHTAAAYRSALARDGKLTARQLSEVVSDLRAARPAVFRLDGDLAPELDGLRASAESLRKRSGTDTGALVPEIAKVFKGLKQLETKILAYMPEYRPEVPDKQSRTGQSRAQPSRTGQPPVPDRQPAAAAAPKR